MGLGAAIGGAFGFAGQVLANKTNKKIAREQMAFQQRMSDASYQRATADMRKAGLNPMLAYSQGGASTPPGASAHMENAISPAVSSALEIKQLNATIKEIDSKVSANESQADLNNALKKQALEQAKLNTASAKGVSTVEQMNQHKMSKEKVHGRLWNMGNNVLDVVTDPHSAKSKAHMKKAKSWYKRNLLGRFTPK